jgi:hypothetical protein
MNSATTGPATEPVTLPRTESQSPAGEPIRVVQYGGGRPPCAAASAVFVDKECSVDSAWAARRHHC